MAIEKLVLEDKVFMEGDMGGMPNMIYPSSSTVKYRLLELVVC